MRYDLTLARVWPFRRVYYGWAVVLAAVSASFGMVTVFGPVLGVFIRPIEQELGWSRFTIALAFTLGSAAGAASSFVVGRVIDRHGARGVVAGAGLLVAGAVLALATVGAPWQLWLFGAIGRGAALGGVEMGCTVAIANWFVRKRGRMFALRGMGVRLGQVALPLIAFAVMAAWGWRSALVALAALAFALIVLPAVLLLRRWPEDLGLRPDGQLPDSSGGAGGRREPAEEVSWSLAEARRTRALWLLAVIVVGAGFGMGSINFHMVAAFQDLGLSDGLAVSIISVTAVSASATVVPWGLLLERLHVRYGAMLMCVVLIVAMGLFWVASNNPTYPYALAFGATYGVASGARTVIMPLLFADYFGRRSVGAIRGFIAPLRMIGPVGPIFAGYVRDGSGSYGLAFVAFTAIFALMLLAAFMAKPPRLMP